MIAMHSQDGSHFLGLRQGHGGGYEIVYEATKTSKRLIWQIKNSLVSEGDITRQFEKALDASAGLRSAEIAFEVDVSPWSGNRNFG